MCVFLNFVLTASILKPKTNIFLDASTEPRELLVIQSLAVLVWTSSFFLCVCRKQILGLILRVGALGGWPVTDEMMTV